MQNIQEQPDVFLKKPDEKEIDTQHSWYIVWSKEWNVSNWLMSSFISALILFEIYAVILSVYPNFMISLWLSLGIQTLMLTSIMTFFTITGLGLFTGAIVYSAHLALTSMENFEKIYMPLIETWSNNAKQYGPILINLLNDENFLKITQTLKDYPAAKPLVEFLKNDDNAESVQKIIQLLRDIWSQDTLDMQVKTLVIHLLTRYVQEDNAKQHIDNIWVLWQFLQKNEKLNVDTIIQVLQNSSYVQALIGQMETFHHNPEMVNSVISKPEILPYVQAMNKAFPQKTLGERATSLRQLCDENHTSLISCTLFCNIQQLDETEQNVRMRLLDGIMSHPQSKLIGQLLLSIQTTNPEFFNDIQKTAHIIDLFQDEPNETLNLSKLTNVIIKLDEYRCFHLIEKKHLSQLEWIHDLLQIYAHQQSTEQNPNKANIEKILLIQSEQEKNDFLKTLQHARQPGEQKKKNRFLPKASSVMKAFHYKNDKTVLQEVAQTEEEKKASASIPAHLEKYRLFAEKKQLGKKDNDNHFKLG